MADATIAQEIAQEITQDAAPEIADVTPGFLDGLALPFMVAIHLLSLVAVAILAGQNGMGRLKLLTPFFIVALLCGLFLSTLYIPDESEGMGATLLRFVQYPVYFAGLILLIITFLSGVLIALNLSIPLFLSWFSAVITAYVTGVSSGVMTESLMATLTTHLGTFTSSLFIFLSVGIVSGWTRGARPMWVKIGLQVIGSWLAAIAVLVMSLGFVT